MARKKHEHHEEHENHERWLVSYADFITLLFAFFTVLYATNQSVVNKASAAKSAQEAQKEVEKGKKYISDTAAALKNALSDASKGSQAPVFQGSVGKDDKESVLDPAALAIDEARKRIEKRLAGFTEESRPPPAAVFKDPKRLSVRLQANDFFDPGEAVLKPDVLPVLDSVGEELAKLGRPIRVEGHTDSQKPGRGGRYRSNWALSAARAVAVTDYLLDKYPALPPQHLMAAGLADTRPIASNSEEAGREQNRRIELVVAILPEDPLDHAVK